MAYDAGLEARIDEMIEESRAYEKKKMFGGICYLLSGNMSFGIWKDSLIVRCGTERHGECISRAHAKKFDITGKPMAGWVMVGPEGIEGDDELREWIGIGASFAGTLPKKTK
jgi:hypothetical protein